MCINQITVQDLGLIDYNKALEYQLQRFNNLIDSKRNEDTVGEECILIAEHPPVYTLGRHANPGNVLRHIPGVEVIQTTRGGDVTCHEPGQMVVYPIIDMQRHHLGVKTYINLLEQSVIDLICEYDVKGERIDGATGVWLDKGAINERKICAIGVKCSKFCTMHGLALNVNNDLKYFNAINPCGFIDKGVTSLSREIGRSVDMDRIKQRFAEIILGHLKIRNYVVKPSSIEDVANE